LRRRILLLIRVRLLRRVLLLLLVAIGVLVRTSHFDRCSSVDVEDGYFVGWFEA
jgi:hypothetical protein